MGLRTMSGKAMVIGTMVVALMAGCGDEEQGGSDSEALEPTTFAVVKDAAEFDATRTEVAQVFEEASTLANQALGGEGVRGDAKVSDTLCNEVYPRRFSRLEGGVTLKAPGASLDEALQKVGDAWQQRGWDVEVVQPDRALLTTKTSTGVPFSVEATLQVNQTDPATIGAGLSAQTRCLKLPQDVADNL